MLIYIMNYVSYMYHEFGSNFRILHDIKIGDCNNSLDSKIPWKEYWSLKKSEFFPPCLWFGHNVRIVSGSVYYSRPPTNFAIAYLIFDHDVGNYHRAARIKKGAAGYRKMDRNRKFGKTCENTTDRCKAKSDCIWRYRSFCLKLSAE